MARYLTPAKITLLLLTIIYSEGAIPLSASTSVLSFLVKHILLDLKESSEADQLDNTLPISQFETHLCKHASSMPGRSVWDLLLKQMWAVDCADALDTLITNLPLLLAKSREQLLRERDTGEVSDTPAGKILRTCPLGAFIRRCHLEYTRLQFQSGVAVWQDFIAYRIPTRAAYEKKNPQDARSALDMNISDIDLDMSHPLVHIMFGQHATFEDHRPPNFSAHDAEKLLEFQVSEMQRVGGRLPESMRLQLKQMSKTGASVPKLAHYLRFLDAWRAGDYSSAYDNIHRYFDYTMQNGDRKFYQYALLNLAILQADFQCYDEAIPAMQEAIATARENRDTVCLNFCMSWLYHFGRTFPAQMKAVRDSGILGSEVEGLAFLKSRAKDAEMWSLLSTSLLSEAKIGLQRGESLALIFENIVKASHITTTKAIPNVTGPTLLMKASAFSRIGQSHVAWACGETFLECYAKDAPMEDVLKCTSKMASLLVQHGRYAEAETLMSGIPPDILHVLKFQNYWSSNSSLFKIRRFLHRNDLDTAERIVKRLKGQGFPDIELEFALAYLEIDLYTRRGDLRLAMDLVEAMAERCQLENQDANIQARVLILKAGLLAKSGSPLQGFSAVMRAANLAYSARLLPTLWDAIGHLAYIFLEFQEFTAVRDLLEAIMPQVLECEDCSLAAHTYSLLADAHMGLAGQAESAPSKRKEQMSLAMNCLEAAFGQYKFVEDLTGQLEMLAKKAMIQHFRGDTVLANDTTSQYLELRKGYLDARA